MRQMSMELTAVHMAHHILQALPAEPGFNDHCPGGPDLLRYLVELERLAQDSDTISDYLSDSDILGKKPDHPRGG